MEIRRRSVVSGLAAGLSSGARRSNAANPPGVTATGLKIGNTTAYSGPASSIGSALGRTATAVFKMVNEQGGIVGHKVDFISLDDGYSPPRTVEDVRRLVEQDEVAFLFQTVGTAGNLAIADYVTRNKIPNLFVASGASKWSDYRRYPWIMGWQPNYRTEAQIYTKYMLQNVKDPRLAILFQNDDFGKDYPTGVRDILGKDWDKYVARTASYETTDPTIDSQIAELQASGANVLLVGAVAKCAAQSIRKVHDLGWKPTFFMSNVAISVGSVLNPAGPENAVGMLTAGYLKDPTDPSFQADAGMKQWRAAIVKYLPGADLTDLSIVYSYGMTLTVLQVLKQCNGDFSRENIMHQAESLQDFDCPVLLPGIKIGTSPTDHRPIKSMQLMRWTGKTWERFGELIAGA